MILEEIINRVIDHSAGSANKRKIAVESTESADRDAKKPKNETENEISVVDCKTNEKPLEVMEVVEETLKSIRSESEF